MRFDSDPRSVGQRRIERLCACARRCGQFFDLRYAIEGNLDLAFPRSANEAPYAARAASLNRDDMDCDDYFPASLLFARERRLLPGRTGLPPLVAIRVYRDYYPTYTDRKFDRGCAMLTGFLCVTTIARQKSSSQLHSAASTSRYPCCFTSTRCRTVSYQRCTVIGIIPWS